MSQAFCVDFVVYVGGSQETAKSKKDTSLALVESVDQSGVSVMQGLP